MGTGATPGTEDATHWVITSVFTIQITCFYPLLSIPFARTVAAEAATCPTLSSIVAKAKAEGNITVKNSPGRNLHRLLNTIMFISAIFKGLRVGKTLKDAVSEVRRFIV